MRRMSAAPRLSIRYPAKTMRPPATWLGGSRRPMIADPVIDLPAPDSPTRPSTSPSPIENETSSMAESTPRRVGISMRRCSTSSSGRRCDSGSAISAELRVERVAQPVAQQIDGVREGRQRRSRKKENPPFAREEKIAAEADERAERRLRERNTETEEGQCRLGDDGDGE